MHITFAVGVAFWFTRRDAVELANDAGKRGDVHAHWRDRYHEAQVPLSELGPLGTVAPDCRYSFVRGFLIPVRKSRPKKPGESESTFSGLLHRAQ